MAALTNCRAIDAYTSDGPGDAAAVAAQAAVRSSNFNDAGDEYDSMGGLTFDGGSTYGGRDENANPNAEYEGNGRGAYGGQGGSREGSGLANSPIAPLPLPRARHHALLVPRVASGGYAGQRAVRCGRRWRDARVRYRVSRGAQVGHLPDFVRQDEARAPLRPRRAGSGGDARRAARRAQARRCQRRRQPGSRGLQHRNPRRARHPSAHQWDAGSEPVRSERP
jgi:hypothetical protein